MTKFEVQRYTLTVETLKVEAANTVEAITKCQESSDDVCFVTEEVIEQDHLQGISSDDHDSADWKRLFEAYHTATGHGQTSLPSFWAIKNCDTNEMWDRYLGYFPGSDKPKDNIAERNRRRPPSNNVKAETLQLFGISPDEQIDSAQCNDCSDWSNWSEWYEVTKRVSYMTRMAGLKCPQCGAFHDPCHGPVRFRSKEHSC